MYLASLATALPSGIRTQHECWEIVRQSPISRRLQPRSLHILEKVLLGPSGISRRRFALDDIERVFELGPDELNGHFRRTAPELAEKAVRRALRRAGLRAKDLDALFICTCTGYLCPGVSSYVAERLGLDAGAFLQDLVGLGCGAALPALRAASHFLAANPGATAAVIAVEISSAAFHLDDDPGVLISACLFGDGAAAAIVTGRRNGAVWRWTDFDTLHRPEDRELLRFDMKDGRLRNILRRSVPAAAADAVRILWDRRIRKRIAAVAVHPGGRDVLAALEPVLAPYPLDAAARILRRCGNLSSPSVLFVLEDILQRQPPTGPVWLTSFGAGFTAHSALLMPA